MECLLVLAAIFTANIVKAIMRDILSLSLGITSEILMVSRQKDPSLPLALMALWPALSLSLSLYEGDDIFFIDEIFNFYLRQGRAGTFQPSQTGKCFNGSPATGCYSTSGTRGDNQTFPQVAVTITTHRWENNRLGDLQWFPLISCLILWYSVVIYLGTREQWRLEYKL